MGEATEKRFQGKCSARKPILKKNLGVQIMPRSCSDLRKEIWALKLLSLSVIGLTRGCKLRGTYSSVYLQEKKLQHPTGRFLRKKPRQGL